MCRYTYGHLSQGIACVGVVRVYIYEYLVKYLAIGCIFPEVTGCGTPLILTLIVVVVWVQVGQIIFYTDPYWGWVEAWVSFDYH